MAALSDPDILTILAWVPKLVVFGIFQVLAVNAFRKRNWAQVGGKLGRRSKATPLPPLPEGFSRLEYRRIVNYT